LGFVDGFLAAGGGFFPPDSGSFFPLGPSCSSFDPANIWSILLFGSFTLARELEFALVDIVFFALLLLFVRSADVVTAVPFCSGDVASFSAAAPGCWFELVTVALFSVDFVANVCALCVTFNARSAALSRFACSADRIDVVFAETDVRPVVVPFFWFSR
jgi:hypothetical protein